VQDVTQRSAAHAEMQTICIRHLENGQAQLTVQHALHLKQPMVAGPKTSIIVPRHPATVGLIGCVPRDGRYLCPSGDTEETDRQIRSGSGFCEKMSQRRDGEGDQRRTSEAEPHAVARNLQEVIGEL